MARTPAQRGRTGNWLVERRLARGWATQASARGEIERLTGWRIPQSVYAEWESGRRVPSDANLDRLREFYGDDERPATAAGDSASIVAALDRLTAAVEAHGLRMGEGFEAIGGLLGTVLGSLADTRARTPSGRAG